MSPNALASAAILATVSAAVFLAALRLCLAVAGMAPRRSAFAGYVLFESGHAQRELARRLDNRVLAAIAATLVCAVTFGGSLLLAPEGWLDAGSTWQRIGASVVVAGLLSVGIVRFAQLHALRRRVVFDRDAHIAIGHGLARAFDDGSRVFHQVRSKHAGTGAVDNVIVGPQGVYAVTVVARRPRRTERKAPFVTIDGTHLLFGSQPLRVAISDRLSAVRALGRELSAVLGQSVRVRSVIAVPGWQVREQNSESHLLVNEDRLAMIRGWTDPSCYLLNEDVAAINSHLAKRCLNQRP